MVESTLRNRCVLPLGVPGVDLTRPADPGFRILDDHGDLRLGRTTGGASRGGGGGAEAADGAYSATLAAR
jgi:hypothetical protein